MAAKKWIYEVKYTDGEEYTYTAPDGKLKSKKLPTVRVEAENRLNAVVAAAKKWGVGWTGVARGVECEIIGPAKKKGDKEWAIYRQTRSCSAIWSTPRRSCWRA